MGNLGERSDNRKTEKILISSSTEALKENKHLKALELMDSILRYYLIRPISLLYDQSILLDIIRRFNAIVSQLKMHYFSEGAFESLISSQLLKKEEYIWSY